MPSPFPGMNPYLEQEDAWQDFHASFVQGLRNVIAPQVSPHYIVKVEEHIYIHEPSAEQRTLIGRPVDFQKENHLEIRGRESRDLIAVLEMLSPTNKQAGPDRDQYLTKRAMLLRSNAHFVELDLLRGWSRMPMGPLTCDYCIMISRMEERPLASIWPLHLRDPLPRIPIPLRAPFADAQVDLLEVLHKVYDAAYYKDYIYHGKPDPALRREDAEWAASILKTSTGD